jgi:hypothetical protein
VEETASNFLTFITINENHKAIMDHLFSRGLPDNYPPRPLSRPSLSYHPDLSRSRHPPTPPPALPRVPVPVSAPGPFPARSDPIRKITPPEEKGIHIEDGKETHVRDEITANDYDKAYRCIQGFKAWRKGGSAHFPLKDYQESYIIKLSKQDWFKLSTELSLEESDG